MANPVPLSVIAGEFGMDRSNLRKYVLKHGFELLGIRTPESKGQIIHALTPEDAAALRELRQSQGFLPAANGEAVVVENARGSFYVVQVVPDLAPGRIKLGFATDVVTRLAAHQTAAPTACLLKQWPCRRSWEQTAICALTHVGCQHLQNEVFDCDDLPELTARGDAFFALLPPP